MSGLSHHPGKVAQGLPCREFESLSLRQKLVSKVSLISKISLSRKKRHPVHRVLFPNQINYLITYE